MREDDIPNALDVVEGNYTHRNIGEMRRHLEEMFSRPARPHHPHYIVAERGTQIAGFGGYTVAQIGSGVYELFSVAVAPMYQKNGIGRALVTKLLDRIKAEEDNKASIVLLTTDKPDFYRKFGFKTLRRFNSNGDSRKFLMALTLQ